MCGDRYTYSYRYILNHKLYMYFVIVLVLVIVISGPEDTVECQNKEQTVFTCVLDTTTNDITHDVEWRRFITSTGTTEIIGRRREDIYFVTQTNGTNLISLLIFDDKSKSDNGYYWVNTGTSNVCNASLTVTTSMYMYLYVINTISNPFYST